MFQLRRKNVFGGLFFFFFLTYGIIFSALKETRTEDNYAAEAPLRSDSRIVASWGLFWYGQKFDI